MGHGRPSLSLGALRMGISGHVCTPIHPAHIQGHLLGLAADGVKYRLSAHEPQVSSCRHQKGAWEKQQLASNLKEEGEESERWGEGGRAP